MKLLRFGTSALSALRNFAFVLTARPLLGRSKTVHKINQVIIVRLTLTLAVIAFSLTGCLSKDGGSAEFSGEKPPAQNAPPVISGNPASGVVIGDPYSFEPNASDADGDTLTFSIENRPSWASFESGTGRLSGQPTLADVGVYSNVTISVSDGQANDSLTGFSITVDQAGLFSTTLSWVAPTQNADGSTLTDLAGYSVYWGTTPGQYTNSVRIDNPSVTTYVVDNLAAGTYEFVATAFNRTGVESGFSNPATKVLQ